MHLKICSRPALGALALLVLLALPAGGGAQASPTRTPTKSTSYTRSATKSPSFTRSATRTPSATPGNTDCVTGAATLMDVAAVSVGGREDMRRAAFGVRVRARATCTCVNS